MSAFRADLPALAELVVRMAAFEQRARAVADELDRQVQRLHGQWAGAAATAHLESHRQWTQGAAAMRAAAVGMRRTIVVAHDNYDAALTANVRMWG